MISCYFVYTSLYWFLIRHLIAAHCDEDDMKLRDSNDNDCDWYGADENFLECGEHDMPPNFLAKEMCCTCKDLPGIKWSLSP